MVVDKHCIGGIPGNRTTLIILPIVAAHGMLMPKTSSRAITSPAGTADTMEVLARVELDPARLAPADEVLISVERPLAMDSPAQMVASILSKKLAAGSTHLPIDIPFGPTAKVRRHRDAFNLRKLFEHVGDRLGLHIEVALTDGRQRWVAGSARYWRPATSWWCSATPPPLRWICASAPCGSPGASWSSIPTSVVARVTPLPAIS